MPLNPGVANISEAYLSSRPRHWRLRGSFTVKNSELTSHNVFKGLYEYHLAKPPHFVDDYVAQNDN
jgi:hypothetical protein